MNSRIRIYLLLTTLFLPSWLRGQEKSADADASLASSVQELREQVQELRSAVAEMKSEAAHYRAESEELRKQLQDLRTASPGPVSSVPAQSAASVEQHLQSLDESTQVLQDQLRSQYQTKVESASKYRVRLSGLVLLNLFSNQGVVDNQDAPTYAATGNLYGSRSTFGGTLRQSEFGLEVFGPQIFGAKSRGEVQVDFGGGFPSGALDGVSNGLVRLRTADVRLDWDKTSLIVGQDSLFFSPLSPTSFASLVSPSFAYSGNLWAWTPQVRVERRLSLSDTQNVTIQAGILDNLTGEPSISSDRLPQAGESSGQPSFAARTSWNATMNGRPAGLGIAGYYSRQNWGPYRKVDGYVVAADFRVPVLQRFELSGEAYRGLAAGGVGGGIGQSVIFSGTPQNPGPQFLPLNSAGGWSQLKFLVTPKLELNGVFGLDSPFSSDVRAVASPVSYYPFVLTANRSEMMNFIYRPRSDLLVSAEYRHLRTSQTIGNNTADHLNLMMGVLF